MELFLIAIAWIIGILMGLYLRIGIAFFVLFIIILHIQKKKNRYLKLFCTKRLMILFLISFLLSFFNVMHLECKFNETYKEISKEINVTGTIISEPLEKQYSTIYILKVEKINNSTFYKDINLKLCVKKENILYKYGDKISFSGEFELPEVQRNAGGFDYREYLKTKNIYGIVKTTVNKIKEEKENDVNFINVLANKIANKIKETANFLLPPKEASILIGVLIGDKGNLEDSTQEAFRRSNLSHMLAVSGAHISYLVMAIGIVISKSKISKNKGKILTVGLLLFFMVLTRKHTICNESMRHVNIYDICKLTT